MPSVHARDHDRAVEARREKPGRPPALDPALAEVLRLQGGAGNHAVARMLAARRPERPVLQRQLLSARRYGVLVTAWDALGLAPPAVAATADAYGALSDSYRDKVEEGDMHAAFPLLRRLIQLKDSIAAVVDGWARNPPVGDTTEVRERRRLVRAVLERLDRSLDEETTSLRRLDARLEKVTTIGLPTAPKHLTGDRTDHQFIRDALDGKLVVGPWVFPSQGRGDGCLGKLTVSQHVPVPLLRGDATPAIEPLAIHATFSITSLSIPKQGAANAMVKLTVKGLHLTARLVSTQVTIVEDGTSILTSGTSIHNNSTTQWSASDTRHLDELVSRLGLLDGIAVTPAEVESLGGGDMDQAKRSKGRSHLLSQLNAYDAAAVAQLSRQIVRELYWRLSKRYGVPAEIEEKNW